MEQRPMNTQQLVTKTRNGDVRGYMAGARFTSGEIFPLETQQNLRASSRLAAKNPTHSLQLRRFTAQKNDREKHLAAAQMRELWNALSEDVVRSRQSEFRDAVANDVELFKSLCDSGVVCVLCDVWRQDDQRHSHSRHSRQRGGIAGGGYQCLTHPGVQ